MSKVLFKRFFAAASSCDVGDDLPDNWHLGTTPPNTWVGRCMRVFSELQQSFSLSLRLRGGGKGLGMCEPCSSFVSATTRHCLVAGFCASCLHHIDPEGTVPGGPGVPSRPSQCLAAEGLLRQASSCGTSPSSLRGCRLCLAACSQQLHRLGVDPGAGFATSKGSAVCQEIVTLTRSSGTHVRMPCDACLRSSSAL